MCSLIADYWDLMLFCGIGSTNARSTLTKEYCDRQTFDLLVSILNARSSAQAQVYLHISEFVHFLDRVTNCVGSLSCQRNVQSDIT